MSAARVPAYASWGGASKAVRECRGNGDLTRSAARVVVASRLRGHNLTMKRMAKLSRRGHEIGEFSRKRALHVELRKTVRKEFLKFGLGSWV